MTDPRWADAIRVRTEQLIEELQSALPEDADPVSIEAALSDAESGYFNDLAQEIVKGITDEKKEQRIG